MLDGGHSTSRYAEDLGGAGRAKELFDLIPGLRDLHIDEGHLANLLRDPTDEKSLQPISKAFESLNDVERRDDFKREQEDKDWRAFDNYR